jgi:hypothetical protein
MAYGWRAPDGTIYPLTLVAEPLAAPPLAAPEIRCHYIPRVKSLWVNPADLICHNPAVTRSPRRLVCAAHRSTAYEASFRHFNDYVYLRAEQRGLLTQAEAFFRIEAEVERRLDAWGFPPRYDPETDPDPWR